MVSATADPFSGYQWGMPDRLFGIPAHPLLVHIPVVLLPLCALFAIVLAVKPRLVAHYGIPLAVLTGISFAGTVLATQSGEGLQHILKEQSAAIERHSQWGDRTRLAAFVFFILALAFVGVARRTLRVSQVGVDVKKSVVIPILAALMSIAAIGTTVAVIYTGHSGAKSAWEDAGKAG